MSFGTLALIGICGFVGPVLAAAGGGVVPVVIGEILAGVVIGRTGFGLVDPGNPTLAFLSEIGFLMLMFSVGMRVPVHDPRVRPLLGQGSLRALAVGVLAVGAGFVLTQIDGVGHPAVYAVLIGSGSAAVVLPIVQERRLKGEEALSVIAQVTVADIAATLAIPFVLRPHEAGRAAIGTLLIAVSLLGIFALARRAGGLSGTKRFRHLGKKRAWAIDLRVALIVLFGLAFIAQRAGSSLLIAGFGAGLMVAAIGGPKRLSTEVLGIAGGFFIPLFFVLLGARLDLRGVFEHPSNLVLTAVLVTLTLAVHLVAARATGQSPAAGLLSSAQLGVPAAVVALGLTAHVVTSTQAAAIIAAAMITVGAAGVGAALLARKPRIDSGRGETAESYTEAGVTRSAPRSPAAEQP